MLVAYCLLIYAFVPVAANIVKPSNNELKEAKKTGPRSSSLLYRVTICQSSIECCDWIYGNHYGNVRPLWWPKSLAHVPPIQAIGLHPAIPEAMSALGVHVHSRRSPNRMRREDLRTVDRKNAAEFTCKDISRRNIIQNPYTHKLVCQFGIRWYSAPARIWPGKAFPQVRCLKSGEISQLESSTMILKSRQQCLEFPSIITDHDKPRAIVAKVRPDIDLNELPSEESEEDLSFAKLQGYWLKLKDETAGISQRTRGNSITWKSIDANHKLIACAKAPEEIDLRLTVGIYEPRSERSA